ncbi:MAG: methyltransferase domain-containing protein [Gammaproteobacteria bacterium]|nr:methyltransferase domain-containing protein [Gammaproteobacteria bacterium]
MSDIASDQTPVPGAELDIDRMPGHWLLARMGKRVLRPGGMETTRELLGQLKIEASDEVVEFAPGLGSTARMILAQSPRQYTGIERDEDAALFTRKHLADQPGIVVTAGSAEDTGLAGGSATVVIGEAMLTMNNQAMKEQIVSEAFRILRPGGRYGIHELALGPDGVSDEKIEEITGALVDAIRVGARPLRQQDWQAMMRKAGFEVEHFGTNPMHLLRPRRVIQDEGLIGALKIARNIATNPAGRRRILGMRRVFTRYQANLSAIYLILRKPGAD